MKNCPTCGAKKPKKMAEGGDVAELEGQEVEPLDDESPAETDDDTEEEEAPVEEEAPAEPEAPAATPAAAPQTTGLTPGWRVDSTGTLRPPPPDQAPNAGTIEMEGQRKPRDDKDDLNEALDLGKIHPKTVNDLFAEKSTLGKIGTLFGLMVSGAGAGLTHQPNAVMELMQRELDRDLEAQKSSQAAKQNWFNAAMAHRRLEGEMPGIQAKSDIETTHAVKNRMRLAVMANYLPMIVEQYPAGPMRQAAQQMLNTVQQYMQQKNSAGNATTAGQMSALDVLQNENKAAPARADGAAVDYDRLNNANRAAGFIDMPGFGLNDAQYGQANQEAAQAERNRAMAKNYMDSFQNLNTLTAGQSNATIEAAGNLLAGASRAIPGVGSVVGGAAGGAASDLANKFQQWRNSQIKTLGIPEDVAEAILPSIYDLASGKDSTREAKFKKGMEYFERVEKQLPMLRKAGALTPFPKFEFPAMKAEKKK